ncbi:MAG: hypothetical protein JSV03_11105 [Planctomycetota bacterium]|nr:MAG: hypothetical protein JSV03_11105 [Planctomycetota bacterium]
MPSSHAKRLLTIGIMALSVASYIAVASYYVLNGELNADEDFYCIAAKRVMSGKILYRDFAYSQMPVIPYVNGLAMRLAGYGFVKQRAINAMWGAITLIIAMVLVDRTAGWPGSVTCGCMFAMSLFWVHFTCLGKTYALAGLFLLIAGAAFYRENHDLKKIGLFSITAALAVGSRLTVVPAVAVLWILLIVQSPTAKQRWLAAILPAVALCCLIVPFYLASPENFWFWNIEYHVGTTYYRSWRDTLLDHYWLAPGVLALILLALAMLPFLRMKLAIRGLLLVMAAMTGIVTQLSLNSSYGENSVPFLALTTVGAIDIIAKTQFAQWILAPSVLAAALALWLNPKPIEQPRIDKTINNIAQFVKAHTNPSDTILTTFPLIAIQAERDVTPFCEMAKFCLTTEMDEDRAKRLHLFTPKTLLEVVESQEPGAIVMTSNYTRWSFYLTVPSIRQADLELMRPAFRAMFDLYEKSMTEDLFLVLIRKPSAP